MGLLERIGFGGPLSNIKMKDDDGANVQTGAANAPSAPSEVTSGKTTYTKGNLVINVFQDASLLDKNVVDRLALEMTKKGLIILPADSTHGNEPGKAPGNIYVDLDQKIKAGNVDLHPELRVTHMDEIDLGSEKLKTEGFAHSLKSWLKDLVEKLGDRFNALNPEDIPAYDKFIADAGGPRVIVGGVGAAPPPHIAYIGEEEIEGIPIINMKTKRIKLRDEEAQRRGVSHAATMGMGEFLKDSVELVMMNAKGKRKEDSIEYALKEGLAADGKPVSGLGILVHQFAFNKNPQKDKAKFVLNIDAAAASQAGNLLKQLA